MKTKIFLVSLIVVAFSSSCSYRYYQVYKTKPSDDIVMNNHQLIFENESCRISYDLWSEGGNIGFKFSNKTSENIYLNLEKSFFILNGIAHNYYKNREYENSTENSSPVAGFSLFSKLRNNQPLSNITIPTEISGKSMHNLVDSKGYNTITYIEEKIVCIPPQTSKIISEYQINLALYRDCDLYKYPTKKQITTKKFNAEDSPFEFRNLITYTIGELSNEIKIENNFHVSEITNYPEKEITLRKYSEFCGQKITYLDHRMRIFKFTSPDMFYIRYFKKGDGWVH